MDAGPWHCNSDFAQCNVWGWESDRCVEIFHSSMHSLPSWMKERPLISISSAMVCSPRPRGLQAGQSPRLCPGHRQRWPRCSPHQRGLQAGCSCCDGQEQVQTCFQARCHMVTVLRVQRDHVTCWVWVVQPWRSSQFLISCTSYLMPKTTQKARKSRGGPAPLYTIGTWKSSVRPWSKYSGNSDSLSLQEADCATSTHHSNVSHPSPLLFSPNICHIVVCIVLKWWNTHPLQSMHPSCVSCMHSHFRRCTGRCRVHLHPLLDAWQGWQSPTAQAL